MHWCCILRCCLGKLGIQLFRSPAYQQYFKWLQKVTLVITKETGIFVHYQFIYFFSKSYILIWQLSCILYSEESNTCILMTNWFCIYVKLSTHVLIPEIKPPQICKTLSQMSGVQCPFIMEQFPLLLTYSHLVCTHGQKNSDILIKGSSILKLLI